MAVFGFLLGSVLGLFGAAVGWAIWDISALTALSIYLGSGLSVGAMVIALCCLNTPETRPGTHQAFG